MDGTGLVMAYKRLEEQPFTWPAVKDGLLGHTQLQTTMRYAHLADDPVRRAAEENAAALSAGLGLGLRPKVAGRPNLRLVEG